MLMWLTSFILLLILTMSFWSGPSRWDLLLKYLKVTISSLTKMSTGKHLNYFSLSMVSLFIMILFLNLCSLISYVFGETSHLAVTLSLSLPFWVTLIVSSIFYDPQKVIASLLPSGAPAALNPFLTLIETVSIGVRPLILALRLGANLTAGHIVMAIIGGFLESAILSCSSSMLLCGVFQAFYTIFEFGISFIQAYIFALLLILYSDDHPYNLHTAHLLYMLRMKSYTSILNMF
uniref:ATP synthase F0 subunit 6 n=1 Tax=Lamellomphalus manusensis TaxID=2013113 RepID=UPI0021CC8078|nr:ATP synthase F0 subunit 6 [Lamellomphalus manusensis]UWT52312.1 ATP synthase F0 subunit 6 [Lamellomphalus manusensis]